jgi:hypothetical protein
VVRICLSFSGRVFGLINARMEEVAVEEKGRDGI